MTKFQRVYRVESHRYKGWDYSSSGWYYLTINTYKKNHYLGRIEKGKMILSEYGEIVKQELLKSFKLRSELSLDEYIIMPNHIHLIVRIVETHGNYQVETHGNGQIVETHGRVSLRGRVSLQRDMEMNKSHGYLVAP